jgi:hypothetical protein
MGIETAENVPGWIQQLVRDIGEQLHPLGFMGQLGFRYLPPAAQANITHRWVIGIYPVPYELSGGKRDLTSQLWNGECLEDILTDSPGRSSG